MRNLEWKKNLCCAVAICSLGEWTSSVRDCRFAEEEHLNRLAVFPAPRNDVLDDEIAHRFRHCEAHEES